MRVGFRVSPTFVVLVEVIVEIPGTWRFLARRFVVVVVVVVVVAVVDDFR